MMKWDKRPHGDSFSCVMLCNHTEQSLQNHETGAKTWQTKRTKWTRLHTDKPELLTENTGMFSTIEWATKRSWCLGFWMVTWRGQGLGWKEGGASSYPWLHYHLHNRNGCRLETKSLRLIPVTQSKWMVLHHTSSLTLIHSASEKCSLASVGSTKPLMQKHKTRILRADVSEIRRERWMKYQNILLLPERPVREEDTILFCLDTTLHFLQ